MPYTSKQGAVAAYVRQAINTAAPDLSNRIYITQAVQSAAFPLAVFSIISLTPTPTQDNGSAIDSFRVQVDVYAKASASNSGFVTANGLAQLIRTELSRDMVGDAYDGYSIDLVQELGSFSDYDPILEVHRNSTDYSITIK
jgi:hypothetical protein